MMVWRGRRALVQPGPLPWPVRREGGVGGGNPESGKSERERQKGGMERGERACVRACACVCLRKRESVCVREKERERVVLDGILAPRLPLLGIEFQ